MQSFVDSSMYYQHCRGAECVLGVYGHGEDRGQQRGRPEGDAGQAGRVARARGGQLEGGGELSLVRGGHVTPDLTSDWLQGFTWWDLSMRAAREGMGTSRVISIGAAQQHSGDRDHYR